MKIKKYLSTYKSHSVFVRTFMAVLGLCLMLILFFCIFIWSIMSSQLREQSEQINRRMLKQTANILDMSVGYVKNDMDGIFRNSQVVKAIVVPDMSNADRNFQVIRCLEKVVHNNPYLQSAYLYVTTNQTIFTSDGTITQLEDCGDSILQKLCLATDVSPENHLMVKNQRILLMMDYPFERPDYISTLIVELDKQALYQLIQTEQENKKAVLSIFDTDNAPVFSESLSYSDLVSDAGGSELEKECSVSLENGWARYSYENPGTGWRYVYKVDNSILEAAGQRLRLLLLPVVMVAFMLSAYLAFYVTNHIYKPIQKLIDSILNKGRMASLGDSRNEFDFLNKVYAEEYVRQEHLSKLAERTYPLIWKTLFTELLLGHCTEEEIRAVIEEIPGGYGAEDYYVVIAATVKQSEDMSAIDSDVCHLGIFNCIQGLSAEKCKIYPVMIETVCVAVILGFNPDVSDVFIKKTVSELIKQIKDCVQGLPFDVRVNPGRVCYSIYNLSYSYQDALENMKYQVYYGIDDSGSMKPSTERKLFGYEYFSARMEPLAESIRRNHVSNALEMVETIVHEIINSLSGIDEINEACSKLIDLLIQKMMNFHVPEQEDIFNSQQRKLQENFDSAEGVMQIETYTLQFARQAVKLMGVYYQKQQHKYVVSVKEYITNNYFSSSISLSSTAEFIGINTSYLSKLFRDNAGEHFTDYLNKYRIEKAKQLLDTTHFTIQEIGFKTGFNTIQNFNRVFKKIVGMTPGQYRGK